MYKHTICYDDFNGEKRTKDLYFNMNKTDMLELDMSYEGGFSAHLERIMKEGTGRDVYFLYKDLVMRAYGEKSADGKQFVKSKAITDLFMATPAYDEFFIQLLNSPELQEAFVTHIVPKVDGPVPAAAQA